VNARSKREHLARALPWLVPAAFLLWHALRYSFVTDDAYISFVYARNLAEHGELSFNLGQPVEGYSNLLWTVSLGLLMVLGVPPELSSQFLGIGFAAGTLFLCASLVSRLVGRDSKRWLWQSIACSLLAATAGYACWSTGGLETQMFTFFVVASLRSYVAAACGESKMRRVAVWLSLACLTRPEGALVAAVVGVHRLLVLVVRDRRLPSRDDWVAVAIIASTVAALTLWRLWYYGHPLPNTYYVKASGEPPTGYSAALWSAGWHYVWQWLRQGGVVFALPIIAVGLGWRRVASVRFAFGSLAVLVCGTYLAYAASVGGDFMGLHRFVMPLYPIVAVAAAVGLQTLTARASLPAFGWGLGIAVLILHLGSQALLTSKSTAPGNWRADHGIDTPAFLKVYTEDRARIGRHMRECFRPDDFSIVGGAGAQPYYGRMRAIDVFGLVSERVAHEVKPTRPRAGHNKWAPDKLLAEFDPDFVFSCYSIHRDPKKPRLNCRPGFWRSRGYELITMRIPGLRQQGEYYTFLARRERRFECEGVLVR